MTMRYFYILAISSILIIDGCKHPVNNDVNPEQKNADLDFTYSGTLIVGDIVYLTSTIDDDSLIWIFEDGDSAIGSSTSHVFLSKANNSVQLIAPNGFIVVKELPITNGTGRMAGTRLWDGYEIAENSNGGYNTDSITDRLMEVVVLNDDSVSARIDILHYDTSFVDHIEYYYLYSQIHSVREVRLKYFYHDDSMTFEESWVNNGYGGGTFLHTQ